MTDSEIIDLMTKGYSFKESSHDMPLSDDEIISKMNQTQQPLKPRMIGELHTPDVLKQLGVGAGLGAVNSLVGRLGRGLLSGHPFSKESYEAAQLSPAFQPQTTGEKAANTIGQFVGGMADSVLWMMGGKALSSIPKLGEWLAPEVGEPLLSRATKAGLAGAPIAGTSAGIMAKLDKQPVAPAVAQGLAQGFLFPAGATALGGALMPRKFGIGTASIAPPSPMEVRMNPDKSFGIYKVTDDTPLESGFKDLNEASARMKNIVTEQNLPKTNYSHTPVPVNPIEKQQEVPPTPQAQPFPLPQIQEFGKVPSFRKTFNTDEELMPKERVIPRPNVPGVAELEKATNPPKPNEIINVPFDPQVLTKLKSAMGNLPIVPTKTGGMEEFTPPTYSIEKGAKYIPPPYEGTDVKKLEPTDIFPLPQQGKGGTIKSEAKLQEPWKIGESGKILNPAQALAKGVQKFSDYMSVKGIPKLSRAGVEESAVKHAYAKISTPFEIKSLLGQVFPTEYNNPEQMSKTIRALNINDTLGGIDQFRQQYQEAIKAGDTRSANVAQQKLQNIQEALAKQGTDEIGLEKELATAWENKNIRDNLNRWSSVVVPKLNELYAKEIQADSESLPAQRGRYNAPNGGELRINLLDKNAEAQWKKYQSGAEDIPMPATGVAQYRNPHVKFDPTSKTAQFTGDYSTDAESVLANVLGRRLDNATKIDFYKDLANKGIGSFENPNNPDFIYHGAKMSADQSKETPFWINRDYKHEIEGVLNSRTNLRGTSFGKAGNIGTQIQIAGYTDAIAHTKNMQTAIRNMPNASGVYNDIIRKFPYIGTADAGARVLRVMDEIQEDSPAIRKEMADLASKGLLRSNYPASGIQSVLKTQQMIHQVDTAGRIVINRMFNDLVKEGLVKDTFENRRAAVNQMGEYNERLMGPIMAFAKQIGASPFVVAGRNYNMQAIRGLTGISPLKATSGKAAVQLWLKNVTPVISALALPAMLNMATTGKPLGRTGTKLGEWDLGYDAKDGKHNTVDMMQLGGQRRGTRGLGIDALIDGIRKGESNAKIAVDMLIDIGSYHAHPWLGPGLQALQTSVSGVPLGIGGKYRIHHQKGTEPLSGTWFKENVEGATKNLNSTLYSIGGGQFNKDEPESYLSNMVQSTLKPIGQAVGIKSEYEQPYSQRKTSPKGLQPLKPMKGLQPLRQERP